MKVVAELTGMMPNIGRPKPLRRLLLARVCSFILLYAVPIWTKALTANAFWRKLFAVYRLRALRIVSVFRTTLGEVAFVIAGMIPFHILAEEMRKLYNKKVRGEDNGKEQEWKKSARKITV